ncbi:MAG: pitrilysin family protein [Gemmatimonadaceae bacterium]
MHLALLTLALVAGAGGDAHAAAATRPRRVVSAPDSAVTEKFDVNGLSVILRRNSANEVVIANLYLLGGARQLTPQTAGIEAMVLAASERGTKRFPGAAVRQRTARLGSRISLEANDDWSAIGMYAIRATFDSTWAIFADRVMAPTLDPAEVAIVRDQLLTVARERNTNPDDAATQLVDSLLYINHPNALSPTGTVESIESLTAAQLKQYHAQQFVTSRMLLVVVGNVDRAQLERLVRGTIATMPKGTYKWSPPPPVTTTGRSLAIDNRPLPTNYLLGYAPGPSATDPDYTALRVATAVLSGRLFTEVRSRRNLSYAVEAPFMERANAVGGLYVTTVDPNQVLRLMRQELTTLQTESVDPVGLKRLEQQFITEYYLKNETNGDQANVLARAELYQGDFRASDRFMENLRRVTPEDVRRVARQYLKDFRFAYVGDASKLDKSLLANF